MADRLRSACAWRARARRGRPLEHAPPCMRMSARAIVCPRSLSRALHCTCAGAAARGGLVLGGLRLADRGRPSARFGRLARHAPRQDAARGPAARRDARRLRPRRRVHCRAAARAPAAAARRAERLGLVHEPRGARQQSHTAEAPHLPVQPPRTAPPARAAAHGVRARRRWSARRCSSHTTPPSRRAPRRACG